MRAAALAVALFAVGSPAPALGAEVVAGPGNSFVSGSVTIDQGGSVTLANRDLTAHDVTARDLGPDGAPLFASPAVPAGGQAAVAGTQYLTTGSYAFFCSLHPQMTGTLQVSAAGTPVPRPGGAAGPPADTSPPRLAIARASGLRAVVTTDEPVDVSATARRRGRVLARGQGRIDAAGRATVKLALTRAGRSALRRARRLGVVVEVDARDSAGNGASTSARAVLRR